MKSKRKIRASEVTLNNSRKQKKQVPRQLPVIESPYVKSTYRTPGVIVKPVSKYNGHLPMHKTIL